MIDLLLLPLGAYFERALIALLDAAGILAPRMMW